MPAEAQKRPKRSPYQTPLATATGNRRTPPRGRTVDGVPKAGPLTEDQARWARRGATTSYCRYVPSWSHTASQPFGSTHACY